MLNQMYYKTLPQAHDASSHITSVRTLVKTRDLAASRFRTLARSLGVHWDMENIF
jgi:hypothetical protein